ncbi:MAG: DUF975 family protein [Lachnospiraceae bacterium]|nr:DUF975 family protein [Lachnospiraceae bacterium]
MKRARDYKRLASERMFTRFGKLAGATAIYGAVYGAVIMAALIVYTLNLITKGVFASIATMQMYLDETVNSPVYMISFEVIILLIGAVLSTLAVGIQHMCLKCARKEEVKLSDLLYVIKNNPDKVIIIYIIEQLLMILFALPANLISIYTDVENNIAMFILSYVLLFASYIADIIIATLFSQALFLYIDNPSEKTLSCIEMSVQVMKKHIGKYVILLISFIPLYILASLSFGLFLIWVIPYKNTTLALFYMQLKGELGDGQDVEGA